MPPILNRLSLSPHLSFSVLAFFVHFVSFVVANFAVGIALAQPSGGPYGPVQQTYEVPKDAAHVYYVAPDGKKEADGTKDRRSQLRSKRPSNKSSPATPSSSAAAPIAPAVSSSINRSRSSPIKTSGRSSKAPKSSTDWENLHNGQWRTKWATLFPSAPQDWWRREREAARTPLFKFNNDLVFADGKRLHPVGWAGDVKEDTYWVDYEKGFVYIGTDPAKKRNRDHRLR